MGFSLDISVPMLTVFLQGIFSFFSPCVLPLLPLYIGYLSGGTGKRGEDGRMYYERKKVLIHTLFFVLGVSFAFFVLGFGVSALGQFFKGNQPLFVRVGGIFIILIGLYQLGIFGTSAFLSKERRLPLGLNVLAMSPVTALLLGFTFSFAWTPCVGPALASVLLMAASAATQMKGFLLIGVYTLGFVLPFLLVGFFTTSVLDFLKRHGNIVTYTVKAGAVLMILMGLMMLTGKMNAVTGYLSEISLPAAQESQTETDAVKDTESSEAAGEDVENAESSEAAGEDAENAESSKAAGEDVENAESSKAAGEEVENTESSKAIDEDVENAEPSKAAGEDAGETGSSEKENAVADEYVVPAIDFTLYDQFGNSHTLSDYKGKTVFLNFWATWCPPCRNEMPDIQKLHEEYSSQEDPEVVILGVAAPDFGGEGSKDEIAAFLEEHGYTYPVVMDETGDLFMSYGVFSYPTTFMIDADGNVFGYVAGQLSEDMMRSIIEQTVTGVRLQ